MSAFLYDAIWMYALALNYSEEVDADSDEGSEIWERFLSSNVSYTGR